MSIVGQAVGSILQMSPSPASSPLGGRTLKAAVHLVLPIAVGAVVLLFLFAQAQIDKRDPKLTGAPIRREDDGMSFE